MNRLIILITFLLASCSYKKYVSVDNEYVKIINDTTVVVDNKKYEDVVIMNLVNDKDSTIGFYIIIERKKIIEIRK